MDKPTKSPGRGARPRPRPRRATAPVDADKLRAIELALAPGASPQQRAAAQQQLDELVANAAWRATGRKDTA